MTEPICILTARLDAESFAWLDGLRRAHFPPARNVLSAHLTMFHKLSPGQLASLSGLPLPPEPIAISFDAVMFLGFGNAIRATAPDLARLRDAIKTAIGGELSRQDNQRWVSHVTIQNKVDAGDARTLHAALKQDFQIRTGSVTGLQIWEYLGGPWCPLQSLSFGDNASGC